MVTAIATDRLLECERVIERGLNTFVEVGSALLEIRDSRLYRDSYSTFEDYCRERWGMSKTHSNRLIQSAEVVGHLTPIGVIPANESQARPLVGLSPDLQVRAWQEAIETAPEGKITGAHVQETVEKLAKPHVAHNGGQNEWYTPPEFIVAARAVMGRIDLDPASSEIANRRVMANTYYTKQDNGLEKFWKGKTWMNPPYASDLISNFISKYAEHVRDGDIPEGIVLVNNATETLWFDELAGVSKAVVFPTGRIRFLDPEGNPGAPLQGQAIVYAGNKPEKFLSKFSEFGWGSMIC